MNSPPCRERVSCCGLGVFVQFSVSVWEALLTGIELSHPKCWEPGEFAWLDSQLNQSWELLFLNLWNAVGMCSLAPSKGS